MLKDAGLRRKSWRSLRWDCQGRSVSTSTKSRASNTFNIYGKKKRGKRRRKKKTRTTALCSHHPEPFVLTRQMEAKDADGSHQDICHFMATACLISDKASSPVGTRRGEGVYICVCVLGGGGLCSVSERQPSKSCSAPFFLSNLSQLRPITPDVRP